MTPKTESQKVIIHIAETSMSPDSGMGRIAWNWKHAIEERGHKFVHIGPTEVGKVHHKGLFPYAAYKMVANLKLKPSLYLVHEPVSGAFVSKGVPTIAFSHGIERRGWELGLQGKSGRTQKLSWRTRILFPLWRLRLCDIGLRSAELLLLSNHEDASFAQEHYGRAANQVVVFKNGTSPLSLSEKEQPENFTVLFLGQWIERKGTNTLIDAAKILHKKGLRINWLIAGTSFSQQEVLDDWPHELRPAIEVIPRFTPIEELNLLGRASLFLLPSFFEGQPLALLQAMEVGRCCITTNCCGQKDIIQDGINGFLHEPGDSQRLASLIEICANDFTQRIKIGANAKSSVNDRSWESVSREVAKQIDHILAI